jgi:hypothetical protein
MTTPATETELLKSQEKELVKQYISYDGSDRVEFIYTATRFAVTGTPCTVTQYVYSGVTTRVIKRLESYSTWDASYDI